MAANRDELKCFVKTPLDAALLIISPDILKPCLQRLDARQRESITSGSCFVFSEDSGLKRWTDGLQWSKSRIDNHFLIYQEVRAIEKSKEEENAPPSPVEEEFEKSREIASKITKLLDRKKLTTPIENGMRKRTFAVSVDGNINHVICYYKDGHSLQTPTQMDIFKSRIESLSKSLLDPVNFRLRGKSPRSVSVPIVVDPLDVFPADSTTVTSYLASATVTLTVDALAPLNNNPIIPQRHATVKNIQDSQTFTLILPSKFIEFKKQVRHQFDLVQDDLQVYTSQDHLKIANQLDYSLITNKSSLVVGFRKDFLKRKSEDDIGPSASPLRFSAALGLLGLNAAMEIPQTQTKVGFYVHGR